MDATSGDSNAVPSKRSKSTLDAIKSIIATFYSAQNALRALAPEFKWAGLGNVLGDYGELVTIEHYGLTKGASGSDGFDARTPDGKSVQVKTNHAATHIGFRGDADLLLVVKVEPTGEWSEVYYGSFEAVKKDARYSARDNKSMIAVKRLRDLQRVSPRRTGAPAAPPRARVP